MNLFDWLFHPDYGGNADRQRYIEKYTPAPGERDINGDLAGYGVPDDDTPPAKNKPDPFNGNHAKTDQEIRTEYQKQAEESYQYLASRAERFRDAANQWEHIDAIDVEYRDTPQKPVNAISYQRGRHLDPINYDGD